MQCHLLTLRNCTVVFASRVPLIVADVILIYLTWSKLSSRLALRDIRQHKRLSLAEVLLRDGTSLSINVLENTVDDEVG